ncbi:MAG TPA: HAD family hydrolase [Candidatus Binataceae bacterium]|nr:HAD family hydrolase [Candidatus Binataceae bacterium]
MRALLFDFGGTLDFPRHWLDRFVGHYHGAGLSLSRAELDPAFAAATLAGYRAGPAIWNYSLRELVAFMVDHQIRFLSNQKMKGHPFYGEPNQLPLIGEMKHLIQSAFVEESEIGLARSRGLISTLAQEFRIGVVSNFYGNLERVLDDAGFGRIITTVADSGRLGVYKPDAGIYAAALAMLGAEARAAVMVGDSLSKDCAPARRVGMRTVWLRHADATAIEPVEADFTIDTLDELEDVLCRMG